MKTVQRELKFRAWDKVKKKWAFKDFNFLGEISLFDCLRQYSLKQLNNLLVDQFTGLKDIDNKDIYENDILIHYLTYEESQGGQIENPISAVKFKDGCFVCMNGYLDQSEACYLKIIGSVHENPELL